MEDNYIKEDQDWLATEDIKKELGLDPDTEVSEDEKKEADKIFDLINQ
jgi:hypothetical protein